jgi:hypothetical protein
MTPRKPVTTARTYGKGSAAKQDALRKGKVAASKAKLDALIARQREAEQFGAMPSCPNCGDRPADPDYDVCLPCAEWILEREGGA